uniref:Uncharacterized protein n=1 Tax=Rhizophora mucronata TaxID=61149 RepID=A0A2P2MCJ8_RHIMU
MITRGSMSWDLRPPSLLKIILCQMEESLKWALKDSRPLRHFLHQNLLTLKVMEWLTWFSAAFRIWILTTG